MSLRNLHELHTRRLGRNLWLSLILVGFVTIIFCLTIVKVSNGEKVEVYDHVTRSSLLSEEKN